MNTGLALDPDALGRSVQHRLVGFVRHARGNGFRVGVAEELDAQRVALTCGINRSDQLRAGLRSLLCCDHRDWRRFDELFDSWWLPRRARGELRASDRSGADGAASNERGRAGEAGEGAGTDTGDSDALPGDASLAGASAAERHANTDFAALSGEDLVQMERLVENLARRMRRRLSRRERVCRQGRRIQMRHTVRHSVATGGTPVRLVYRERRRRLPRLVVVVDVSRSMSIYSQLFLRFSRGLLSVFRDAAAFACHTRLVPITEALRQPDGRRLAESLALISMGWSGGTRLGESLESLCRTRAGLITRNSLVVIVSDGLDTGAPERLAAALRSIRQRARRLIWLNPLLGRPGYEARAGAMAAALPHLDRFAPANDLRSLAALESVLAEL
jgi:uncharacterized protein with von Willebrand factor type A (vWA) domain